VNCGLRIADCGLRVALLTLVLATAGYAQSRPPADDEARPAPFGAGDLVEKGSDLDKALRAGNWERAELLLVKKIEAAPQSAELLKLLARVFLADRRPLNAAIAIKKAEAIAPLDSQTRYQLAIAYLSMNHGDWARPELERLAQADPTNPLYQYWLGRVDYDAGHYASAAKRFEEILEADDTFTRAHDNLGLCYEAMSQPDLAMAHYRKAIALNRKSRSASPWPPLNLGILLVQHGELREAEALFREAMGYDAGFPQAHYQLGMLFEQTERLDDGVKELRRAIEIDQSYAEPYFALARIYRRQGKTEAATEALATFQRLHDAKREAPAPTSGGAEAPPPQ
jgi:tetratricopeptide (TPR) repeat protein